MLPYYSKFHKIRWKFPKLKTANFQKIYVVPEMLTFSEKPLEKLKISKTVVNPLP
jgi:hypothetical protein